MGYKVGMPVMKLDRNNHFGQKDSRSGNARAVACEALEERYSSDADLNRALTDDNVYWMPDGEDADYFTSGNELADYWERMADEYRTVDRNGREKKLRSDAGIAFAGICKPEKGFMDTLSNDEQLRFMEDSANVICEIYKKRGLEIDAMVVQFDEMNPHLHYFGHDPKYQLGKKLGLPLFKALNDTEYPEQMRQLGWDIDALKGYDLEATKSMTDDELSEYKVKHRAERGKGGKPSAVYKAERDAQHIVDDAQAQAQAVMLQQDERARQLELSLQYNKAYIEQGKAELQKREADLDDRENALEARRAILDQKDRELQDKVGKASEIASEALRMYRTANEYYHQEQAWMGSQAKQHIREQNAKSQHDIQNLKEVLRKAENFSQHSDREREF